MMPRTDLIVDTEEEDCEEEDEDEEDEDEDECTSGMNPLKAEFEAFKSTDA
ncbi:hypothetical protein DIPPA_34616 [Diplonema papillatum]|nr:hypothetical protein DIPPA_34616 [Diplonema papillatum]